MSIIVTLVIGHAYTADNEKFYNTNVAFQPDSVSLQFIS